MATVLNVLPMEAKTNVPQLKGTKQESGKGKEQPSSVFSKLLDEADKKELDSGGSEKENGAAQFMAVMTGMMNFPVIKESVSEEDKGGNTSTTGLLPDLVKTGQQGAELFTALKASPEQLKAALSQIAGEKELIDPAKEPDAAVSKLLMGNPELVQEHPVKQQENQNKPPLLSTGMVAVSEEQSGQLTKVMPFAVMGGSGKTEKGYSQPQMADPKQVLANGEVKRPPGAVMQEGVKPVAASQAIATVSEKDTQKMNMDQLLPQIKQQTRAESIAKEPEPASSDTFTGVFSQQLVKQDHTVMASEVKSVQVPVKDPHQIAAQIVDQARLIEGPKNTEMVIKLKPEHLGELTFKVTVENGVVSASFHSSNAEVRNALEGSLLQLKQDLANQGLKVENVGIYAGLGEFFSNGQRESQRKPEVKVQNKKTEDDFVEALESTNPAITGSDSGVDYRV